MMSPKKIAWIGVGKMGLSICKRLKAAGYDAPVLAPRSEQSLSLAALGFAVADNAPDLVRGANIVFTAVTDDQVLGDVVLNSMVAATSALLGEALAFGLKGGLTHANMLDVIMQSAVASPLIGCKNDMIISGDYGPAATLNMLNKDLDLLLSAAQQQGTSLPVNGVIKKIHETASANGLGEKDFFVLVQEAEKAAGAKTR
jgi:3-hydroxyisobutyrate dehydrogenase-like beta-hydroxyacid dehydrogenase